jgi:hypothetical protein
LVCKEPGHLNGYNDIVIFRDQFIAVGTDGRIDRISKSGEITPIDHSNTYRLNNAYADDKIFITVGERGTILYSTDGKTLFHPESGTDKNIYGITSKNKFIIAGADSGIILTSKNGKSWDHLWTKAKGNILSLSSNNTFFIGVTDAGEIIKSNDGIHWNIQDYNKEYAGYNPYSKFAKVLAVEKSIIIIGTHEDGSPSILTSSLGNVWTERLTNFYKDQNIIGHLTNTPNGITYNPGQDEFILACDEGALFTLPACTKCNKYIKISENDFNALIYNDSYLLVVGADYSVAIQRL